MAPANLGLGGIVGRRRFLTLAQFRLIQAGLQHVHRGGAVLVLRAVILRRHDDARGHVGDADRGVGGVDVLAARTRGAIGIDLEVGFLDLDIDIVVDHRIDPDRRETGVTARGAVIGADADQAVDAAFGLGIAIGILALDEEGGRLDAGGFARLIVDQFHLIAAPFGPAAIHAAEDFGPVLAFGATGAGVDFQIGVAGIGFARQQRLDLVLVCALGQRLQRGDGF